MDEKANGKYMDRQVKKKFNWKVFTSIGLFYTFFVIFLTGIVLYMAPSGRVAHWVTWKFLFLTKEDWQAVHTVFSLVFVILSIFHLFTFNWGLFFSYLKKKSRKGLHRKREFYFSTFLMIAMYFGVLYSVPPLHYITDFSEYLKESWEKTEAAPPVPHAELLSLEELAGQLDNISLEMITRRLKADSIIVGNTEETLLEIAESNGKTPNEIYELIMARPQNRMAGSGIGRKTIEEFAMESGKDPDELIKILNKNHIQASKDRTLRDIAAGNDLPPREIFELIAN